MVTRSTTSVRSSSRFNSFSLLSWYLLASDRRVGADETNP